MQQSPQSVAVNGVNLSYVEQGTGDPVVFVHGSLGDFRSWGPQLEAFAQRYRTIAFSRRRHWPNQQVDDQADYSVEEHASDLGGFIDALGLDRPHVIGSSYGALAALTLATRRTHDMRTLVLGEPPFLPLLDATPEGRALFGDFMTRAWLPAGAAFGRGEAERAIRVFMDGVMGEGVFDNLPDRARAAMMDNADAMGVELRTPRDTYFPQLTRADVAGIPVPVLLVTGQLSPAIFRQVTDELETCLPDAERAEIANASHGMHLGNPAAYNETVLAFLDRH